MKHPPRDWRNLTIGECQKVIQHCPGGGRYYTVAVNSEGLLAVTDFGNRCVHLLTNNGTLVRSIGKGVFGGWLFGVAIDLKRNIWVADYGNNKVVKLSQDGRLLQTIYYASCESDCFSHPRAVSVSADGRIYICDQGNHRVTVHDDEGRFLFSFGSKESAPGCFNRPGDIAFGSDALVYVTDSKNKCVCAWSKDGKYRRVFKVNNAPTCIAATNNFLLITSYSSHTVMMYTLEGELIHQFGAQGSDPGRFSHPYGICVDGNELVYVVDGGNERVQVF